MGWQTGCTADVHVRTGPSPCSTPARRKLESTMTNPAVSPSASQSPSHKRYFFEKFAITERLLERCLGEALSAGGDYADLYFESVTATSLGVDEQIVKSASQGTSAGCGIRVLSGDRTGYAYTDNLSPDRLLHAARTAALIASGPATQTVQGFTEDHAADLEAIARQKEYGSTGDEECAIYRYTGRTQLHNS